MITTTSSYTLVEGGAIDLKMNENLQIGPLTIDKTKSDGGKIYLFMRYQPEQNGFRKIDFLLRRWDRPSPDAMGATVGDTRELVVFEAGDLNIWDHADSYNLIFVPGNMNYRLEYFRLYWYPTA